MNWRFILSFAFVSRGKGARTSIGDGSSLDRRGEMECRGGI